MIDAPLISIIIPVRNEAKYISKCLDSFISQSSGNFEIIVIDGLSVDGTSQIIDEYVSLYPGKIKKFENQLIRTPYALNIGLENAKGKFILLFGAHAFVKEDFLKINMEAYNKINSKIENLAGVGGRLVIANNKYLSKIFFAVSNSLFGGAGKYRYTNKSQAVETIVYGFYNREKISAFFDTELYIGQDLEFNLKLIRDNKVLYFCPNIQSFYFARDNLKKFFRQMTNAGTAKGHLIRKKYFRFTWIVPSVFISYLILTLMYPNVILFIPLIIYIILNIFFSLNDAIKFKDPSMIIFLPLMYFILHSLIGIGVIFGIIFKNKVLL
ncbi:MAG: glycosyltransferase [Candidatus Methanoperedens sp.]|nr:glycosyltransferase [Candidatus Methanoperedens sp.]